MGNGMAFHITMLAGPLVGSLIGYFTNYIAVKMLFRPLYPVYIGKWQLPFTPGIIPKGKARLAKAVGEAVGDVLLTKEDFEQLFLSESMQENVKSQVSVLYRKGLENQNSFKDSVGRFIDPKEVDCFFDKTADTVSELLYRKMIEMNLGSIVGEKAEEIVRRKTQGTLFAMMLSDKMIVGIRCLIEEELNRYLKEDGKELIQKNTQEEIERLAGLPISELMKDLSVSEEEFKRIILALYQNIVANYFGTIMEYIPISRIVEEKIQSMDVKEVENLTLLVMSKELNSIVNLGAWIGLIIGCINLLF